MSEATTQTRSRSASLAAKVTQLGAHLKASPPVLEGRLVRMVGLTFEAVGCQAAMGSRCRIVPDTGPAVDAEVVGFSDAKLYLMPIGDGRGLTPNARVIPLPQNDGVGVGPGLLGRVIDGAGAPLDDKGMIFSETLQPLQGQQINPLTRKPIAAPFDVGIKAVNALLTVGRGQRMGLFAGSGVGKSTLLGLMTRYAEADVVVVGLIGERGREVQEFIQHTLGEAGLKRAVIVATPADSAPLMRVHGALRATAIAEYFRDQGQNVLLLMDSLTRFAQAQREIALSIGELPVSRGFPPSVFAKLPQLVERAGMGGAGGSITAIYTILVEGDDMNEPVADAVRGFLDGHIVLDRNLANANHFPAIDVLSSVSRLDRAVCSQDEIGLISKMKVTLSEERLEQELAVLLTKLDVTEEVDRLSIHLESCKQLLQAGRAVGRRLDFIRTF